MSFSSLFNSIAEGMEQLDGILPTQAGIGDAFTIFQFAGVLLSSKEFLRASTEVAFHHDACDMLIACTHLSGDICCNFKLLLMLLA